MNEMQLDSAQKRRSYLLSSTINAKWEWVFVDFDYLQKWYCRFIAVLDNDMN